MKAKTLFNQTGRPAATALMAALPGRARHSVRAASLPSKPGAHGVTRPTIALGCLLLLSLLLPLAGRADVAPGTLMWFQSSLSSGSGTAEARAMAVDLNDNTIVVGRFVGTNNFFGTTLIATSDTIPSGFVAKFGNVKLTRVLEPIPATAAGNYFD